MLNQKEQNLLNEIAQKIGVDKIEISTPGMGYYFFQYKSCEGGIHVHNYGHGWKRRDFERNLIRWLKELNK